MSIKGYNCDVCKGHNIQKTNDSILHFCEGVLIPVYENTIRFNIPKGYKPKSIQEWSDGGEYYIKVELRAIADMCTIKMPHDNCDKCDK